MIKRMDRIKIENLTDLIWKATNAAERLANSADPAVQALSARTIDALDEVARDLFNAIEIDDADEMVPAED